GVPRPPWSTQCSRNQRLVPGPRVARCARNQKRPGAPGSTLWRHDPRSAKRRGMAADNRVAIFLHSGDYARVHPGLAIAAAAVASGREVHLFFFWWALDRLLRGDLGEPTFEDSSIPLESREAAEDAFESGYPTASQLMESVRASGKCTIYACSAS